MDLQNGQDPNCSQKEGQSTDAHSSLIVVLKTSKPALLTFNPGTPRHPEKYSPCLLPLPLPAPR